MKEDRQGKKMNKLQTKIKLRRHYCQLDNGPRVRCWYSRGGLGTASDAVTICAKTHCDNLSEVFPADLVENDTDIMTDYFEKDRVRILPGDPLWDDACAMAAAKKGSMKKGDYVLATKYSDGDPQDHWYVGMYDREAGGRHYVTDGDGNQARGNGFRRAKKISADRGAWMLANAKQIEQSGKSIWWWVQQKMDITPAST